MKGGICVQVGFIGTGSMGSVLIHALVKSNAVKAEQLRIRNRTPAKAQQLAEQIPGLSVAASNAEIAVSCQLIFVCVKPLEFGHVLTELAPLVRAEQIVVSITSPVLIRQLEDALVCKVAKIIPSITNYELGGATLCMYGQRMTDKDKELLESLLCHIGTPVRIEEQYARVMSDICSIGPAFMGFWLQQLIDAAVERTGVSHQEATRLGSDMLLGTGLLLTSGGFSPQTLQQRVSVPGGITAKALGLLNDRVHGLFNEVIEATHRKYDEDVRLVEDMLRE